MLRGKATKSARSCGSLERHYYVEVESRAWHSVVCCLLHQTVWYDGAYVKAFTISPRRAQHGCHEAWLGRCALVYAAFGGYEGLSYKATARAQAVMEWDTVRARSHHAFEYEHEVQGIRHHELRSTRVALPFSKESCCAVSFTRVRAVCDMWTLNTGYPRQG